MRTPASIFKHPIHPILIVFPIGLWIFSLVCDLIRLAGASQEAWSTVAFFSMVGGLIGALGAAAPGFIDLLFYKGGAPPVKKIALTHMTINLIAVVRFDASRRNDGIARMALSRRLGLAAPLAVR